ncbi:hypothetical protein [Phenylobacterium sp.]|jgi:hypothetical protein|uniref:hypothetical protein n=1 Tax=Phenylobacterium sp. TaxID=1871053 RepID=UPI00289B4E9E|nr:hypothetical protein [Phenylobacterium sp.]
MSQKNGTDSTGFALAVVVTVIGFAVAVMFALAAFAALVLSLLCLAAWNKPLTIGDLTLEPPEARAFVVRGLIGTVVVPAFALFCAVLFQTEIDPDYWPYLLIGGYTLGSVGIGILLTNEEGPAQQVLPPLPVASAPLPPSRSDNHPCGHARCPLYEATRGYAPTDAAPPPRQFQYAEWDDEEVRR